MADKKYFAGAEEKVTLPRAPQKFPALDKPDTSTFALGKCKDGVWKTTALYKADSTFIKELTAKLDALYDKGVADVAKVAATMPTTNAKEKKAKADFSVIQAKNEYFKADTDKEGNETGYVQVNVKLNVSTAKGVRNSFVLVDAKKTPMPRSTAIWGGTEAIIKANAKFYNLAGPKQSGISFQLLGMQVLNLVGPGGGNRASVDASDFDEEEGHVYSEGDSTASPRTDDTTDEDVPF